MAPNLTSENDKDAYKLVYNNSEVSSLYCGGIILSVGVRVECFLFASVVLLILVMLQRKVKNLITNEYVFTS